jgi:hypothetical protein
LQAESSIKDGYETRTGDHYFISHYLDINNCWMVVAKEAVQTETVDLNVTVFNMAMDSSNGYSMKVGKLSVIPHFFTDVPQNGREILIFIWQLFK